MNESLETKSEIKDEILVCCDCSNEFIFYKGEQEFFKLRESEMKQQNPTAEFKIPKRCKICRKKYKAERSKLISVQLLEKKRFEENRSDFERWKQQISDLKDGINSNGGISSYSIVSEHIKIDIVPI